MTPLSAEELTLGGLLGLAIQMPEAEQRVAEVVSGLPFDAEAFTAAVFGSRGIHHEIRGCGCSPVAAGGFLPVRGGVYRTWFCAPEWAWQAHGAELTRVSAQAIQALLADGLAHRIETVTLASETRARRWYEKIGLAFESTLYGYGSQGEDLVMYVALKKTERA